MMKTKTPLLVGIVLLSTVLAACTQPSAIASPVVGGEVGEGDQGETDLPPVDASEEPTEPVETAEPTEIVEPSETPAVTEPPEVTETAEPTDDGTRAGCPGNPGGIPPTAGTLATTFSVGEEEIMGWFCQGFGFGEIKKAYLWASLTGKTVDELFALKQSGMGWGQIAKTLDIKPGGKPCWAGKDKGSDDPECVKPGGKPDKVKKDKPDKNNGNGQNNGKGGGKPK